MGANNFKSIIVEYVLRKIGISELNTIADVEVEGENIWITLEDGSIKSVMIINAGRQEKQKLE